MTDLQEVEADIVECLSGLKTMESEVRRRAREQGIDPMMMRHADGALVMERLIISRAQLLTALAPIVANRESGESKPDEKLCSVCDEPITDTGSFTGDRWVHSNGFAHSRTPGPHWAKP